MGQIEPMATSIMSKTNINLWIRKENAIRTSPFATRLLIGQLIIRSGRANISRVFSHDTFQCQRPYRLFIDGPNLYAAAKSLVSISTTRIC